MRENKDTLSTNTKIYIISVSSGSTLYHSQISLTLSALIEYILILWASLVAQTVKNLARNADLCSIFGSGRFPWRREWHSTPESLPGESHEQGSLVSYSPWGHKELDITELLTHIHPYFGCVLIMSPCHLYNLYW